MNTRIGKTQCDVVLTGLHLVFTDEEVGITADVALELPDGTRHELGQNLQFQENLLPRELQDRILQEVLPVLQRGLPAAAVIDTGLLSHEPDSRLIVIQD